VYEFDVLFRGMAIGVNLTLLIFVLSRYHRLYIGWVLAGVSACLCAYLIGPMIWQSTALIRFIVQIFAESVPLLFLWFALAIFEDHQRPPAWSLWIGLAYISMALLRTWLGADYATSWLTPALFIAPQLTKLALVLWALAVIARHWRTDLVQGRRMLRKVLLPVISAYMGIVVVAELSLATIAAPQWLDTLNSLGVALLTLTYAHFFLRMDQQDLLPQPAAAAGTGLETADQLELDKLQQAMQEDCLYRDMALTIRSLAETLAIPEHRLRLLINGALGYRNFNDYLNRYRAAEAASRLRDPALARTPVLTIAMDAGYRSMTTFNKAFKSIEGMTPREYRLQTLDTVKKT